MPKIILFSIGVLFHFMGSSQSSSVVIDTLWWDRMGYGGDEVLERMVVAEDNTLWCIGTTSSSEGYGQDLYLLHLDSMHQCLGSFSFGGNGVDLGVDLMFLPNGQLLLLGTTSSFTAQGYDAVLYVVDTNGQLLESKILEEEGWQFAQRFATSQDGVISISGRTLNNYGQWDLALWKVMSTGGMGVYNVLDRMNLSINTPNLESSFVTHQENDGWVGFASYWNEDSIPLTRTFELDNQWSFQWDTVNVLNGDSVLMHDAIVKEGAMILVGGFYHNNQFRPQLMKWLSGQGMWSISNYPNYQRETMFHGVGFTQDSLVYCAVGWSFEFGFGMGGGFYNYFDTNDQWMGNGFIGGDLLCKMNDVVFDKNNHLHSVGLDKSHSQGMSQQAWLVRGNGCLFIQPNTFQIENTIVPCFTVGGLEFNPTIFDYSISNGTVNWTGDAQWLGAYDAAGRKLNHQNISPKSVQLAKNQQVVFLQWLIDDAPVVKRVFISND